MKKIALLPLLSVLVLASCGGTSSDSTTNQGTSSSISESASSNISNQKELQAAYISPAVMSYMNMRPTYNYYITTYSFEYLETFSDKSYTLTISSTTYSGLVLPDEGNAITGNERTNYISKYYGSFEAVTNALDEDSLDITLKVPSRVTMNYDSTYFVDSANWTETMKEATATKDKDGNITASFDTGSSYLASTAFSQKEVSVSKTANSFDYFALRDKDEANPIVAASTGDSLAGSYISPANLGYMNMRPSYNYYMTIMNQESLDLIDDDDYVLSIYSSNFTGVNLPSEGNNATGSDRANYVLKFFGKYTSETNSLDEDTLDVTLKVPSKVTLAYDAKYYVDSNNFDDLAKTNTTVKNNDGTVKTEYDSGAEYLASFQVAETLISVTKPTSSFDYSSITAQLY